MDHDAEVKPRQAARVLVISDSRKILLLKAREPRTGHELWLAPGGGLGPGESFEAAARRELEEETGLVSPIGPCVWTRRHRFVWDGVHHDQREWFFVMLDRVPEVDVTPPAPDTYTVGHRWWSIEEIAASEEDFAPRRLAELLVPLFEGRYPDPPVDCGV